MLSHLRLPLFSSIKPFWKAPWHQNFVFFLHWDFWDFALFIEYTVDILKFNLSALIQWMQSVNLRSIARRLTQHWHRVSVRIDSESQSALTQSLTLHWLPVSLRIASESHSELTQHYLRVSLSNDSESHSEFTQSVTQHWLRVSLSID